MFGGKQIPVRICLKFGLTLSLGEKTQSFLFDWGFCSIVGGNWMCFDAVYVKEGAVIIPSEWQVSLAVPLHHAVPCASLYTPAFPPPPCCQHGAFLSQKAQLSFPTPVASVLAARLPVTSCPVAFLPPLYVSTSETARERLRGERASRWSDLPGLEGPAT